MSSTGLKYKNADELPPCVQTCPAGIDIPRYIRFIAEGKFAEAVSVIREKNPFPSVCGYVCLHPCEDACQAGKKLDEPIAIRALHRYAGEHAKPYPERPMSAITGKRVAIVGSGPAGLTGAYYLAKLGHKVTVFESQAQAGGWLRTAIPAYRLPKEVVDGEIQIIKDAGVGIETDSTIDSLDELFEKGYEAIFIAIGAHKPLTLGIEGEDDSRVIECIDLLQNINLGKRIQLGNKVAVIGGGNAAIDAARSAIRLGAKEATILYRRTRDEMPASPEEVGQAIQEGVQIEFLTTPKKIISDEVLKLECIRMKLGSPDATGRSRPMPVPGSEFVRDFYSVITAIGQEVEAPAMFNVPYEPNRGFQIDPDTLETARNGVFAGGDAIRGPALVIEAIADGRKAAHSIDKYLGGRGLMEEKSNRQQEMMLSPQRFCVGERNEGGLLPAEERLKGFATVELGFAAEEDAINEAGRCLRCDLPITVDARKCVGCLTCCFYCSLVHQGLFSPMRAYVKVLNSYEEPNTIFFTDDCDDCGTCALYCPYGALTRETEIMEGASEE